MLDGGLSITTPWTLVDSTANVWGTTAPAQLIVPGSTLPVRTMFVGGVRYNRTRDDPSTFALLGSQNSFITPDGYLVTSRKPQAWIDLTTVEIVRQGPFTQTTVQHSTVH